MFKHGSFDIQILQVEKIISSYLNNVMHTKVKENNLFFLPNLEAQCRSQSLSEIG